VILPQLEAEMEEFRPRKEVTAVPQDHWEGINGRKPHPGRREVTCGEYTYGLGG